MNKGRAALISLSARFMWIFLALAGAFFTGLVAIVSKIGLAKVDSSFGFAVQSVAIVISSWLFVILSGKSKEYVKLEARDWGFLLLAGVISTVAYLFYFGAIKAGDVSRVGPLDRLSLVFSIVLAAVFLSEKVTTPVVVGGAMMTIGALVIAFSGSGK